MEAKYYTPEPSEFHEGFQFQANYTKEGWTDEIFGVGTKAIYSLPQLFHQFLEGKPLKGNIRVKHLDREDIESLGFIKTETRIDYGMAFKYKNSKEDVLYIWLNKEFPVLRFYDPFTSTLCQATIKNISELKKLMVQLNIK